MSLRVTRMRASTSQHPGNLVCATARPARVSRRGLRFDQQYAYAVWDRKANRYRAPDGTPLNGNTKDLFQYHQLIVWANIQNTLDFFESGFGLGRRISWAFEGNRLR